MMYKTCKGLPTGVLFLTTFLLLFTFSLRAQVSLQGSVRDTLKQPIPGVAISLKSVPGEGTISDSNGTFSLRTEQKLPVTLVFRFLGYQTREVIVHDGSEPIVVTLSEEKTQLDEVVVTALGISRARKSLGYTTQEIRGEALDAAPETNLLNSLSGKLAGVRITNSQGDMGSSRIVIRGETSIAGNNQPLFIVDGVPVDNSQLNFGGATRDFRNAVADLNPEDIATMSVLKGPNAAALYGSRAAHGVILITTKSGKGQKGIGVSINSGVSFSRVASLPEFQNVFGQGTNGAFSYVNGAGAGVNDGVDESWGPRMDGRLIPQFHSNGEAVPFVPHPDNVKDFFETGVLFDEGISVAGSDERFDFRLGANYQDQQGTVPNTQTKKTNFSINTNYQLTKKIRIGTTANYIITDVPNLPGGPSGGRSAGVMLQFLWFGRQVDIDELKKDRTRNWNNSYYSNPYWNAYYNTVEQKRNRLIGDIHLDVNLADGLDFKFRTGTDYYNDRRKYKIKYGTNGTPYGSYAEDAYTVNENNTEALLNFKKDLNRDFSLDAIAGFNVRNKTYSNNYQKAPRLAVPDLYTLTNSRDPLTSSNDYSKLRVYSVYASAQAGYKNFAFLNVTGRNDWSSTLPRSNRSYFYPSVSASVILTDAFRWESGVLDFLKIRGGWSEVGSDADPYQLATVYNFETAFEGNPILTSSKEKNNPELKPETTRSTELGAEASFLKNRIHLDLAFYNTNSIDQILKVNTSASSGYTSQLLNAGKINNKGVEIQLDATPVQRENFQWNAGVNFSRNKSKVVSLDKEGLIQSYTVGSYATTQVLATIGEAYGSLYGTAFLRDANGRIVVGSDGLPDADPANKILGHYSPDWLAGVTNTFSYKNVSLSFLIDASVGGKIYSGTNRTGIYTGVLKSTLPGRDADHGGLSYYYPDNNPSGPKSPLTGGSAPGGETVYEDGIIVDGVTADGSPNKIVVSAEDYYKSLYNISEAFLYDASFVKFREITLSYKFKGDLLAKIGLKGATVSLVGRNLFFIYKDAPNIDPEVAFNTTNAQGIESLSLPTTRTLGFNINLNF